MSFSFPGTSKKHLRFGIILLVSLIIGILFNVYTNPPQPRTKADPYAGLFDRKGQYLIQEKTVINHGNLSNSMIGSNAQYFGVSREISLGDYSVLDFLSKGND